MPEILVRNVDETVVKQLESRARTNGRSLEAELKLILEQAARPASARISRAEYRALADQIRAEIGDRPQADSAGAAGRGPKPNESCECLARCRADHPRAGRRLRRRTRTNESDGPRCPAIYQRPGRDPPRSRDG